MTKKEKERRKAAKRGNASEKYELGWHYHYGLEGVSKNLKEAVKWYRQAANQGHVDAQADLGKMYEAGDGVRQSNVNACMWYKRAMDQGQETARANYNRIVQKMTPKARDRVEAKAEEKMAYVKQLIKSFLKKVFFGVVLVISGVSVVLLLFPKSPLTPPILDVKASLLDKANKHKWWGSQEGPPQIKLEREDFTWLSGPLYGNETDTLSIRIKNYGGYARDMTIELSSNVQGLSFLRTTTVRTIPKDGVEAVNIPISGDISLLPTRDALLDFQLNEPNHGLKYEKKLFFETRKFRNPQLILVSAAFEETVRAMSNNQINKNDQIELKFYMQNVGCSAAKEVKVSVDNKQRDEAVRFLGRGDDYSKASQELPIFSTIDAGEYKLITYHYLVTGEFKGDELKFEISTTESFNKYGFDKELVTVRLNEELDPLKSPTERSCDEEPYQELRVEDIDKELRQESQGIAESENGMQAPQPIDEKWFPDISDIPIVPIDSDPLRQILKPSLDLSEAEISGYMFTSHNPPAPFNSIKLEFSIQNVGYDAVKQVEVQVENDQSGVAPYNFALKKFSTIDAQKRKQITYEYFIDIEKFNDHEFKFKIHVTYMSIQYLASIDLDTTVIDSIDINDIDIIDTMKEKWEIKRPVAPYSEVQVISLP